MSNHDNMNEGPHGLVAISFRTDEHFLGPFERGRGGIPLGRLQPLEILNLEGKVVCNAYLTPGGDEPAAIEFMTMLCEARSHVCQSDGS
jgi:hypothetical protein